jgi:hypothetical protein
MAKTLRRTTACLLSACLAPAPVASLVLIAAAAASATPGTQAVVSAAVAIGCAVIVPTICIRYGVRRGWLTRCWLPRREERPLPLLIGVLSVGGAAALVQVNRGGQQVLESLYAMAFVLMMALAVTLVWKISLHVAALTGAVVIIGQLFGAACILLVPLVVLVAWSRVELDEHTLAQVGGGALVGILGSLQPYLLAL